MMSRCGCPIQWLSRILILSTAAFLAQSAVAEQTSARPNIVFIMTDQQHAGMMSCSGNAHLATPALDRLAREGIRFERAYVANPVCVPSRISMATGVMPGRFGVFSNQMKAVIPAEVEAGSLGKLIRRAGYDTFYGGKVHMCPELNPPNAGYDVVERNQRELLPDAFKRFVRQERDQPFFAVASFINPHDICFAHAACIGKTPKGMQHVAALYRQASSLPLDELPPLPANYAIPANEPNAIESHLSPKAVTPAGVMRKEYDERQWRIYRWIYCRLTEQVDEQIGRIVNAVTEAGLDDKTLIVFTSDHGNMDASHRLASKGQFYDESARVPFLMKYRGVIEPGQVDDRHLVATGLDILPTLCDYAGAEVPASLLGRSLRPIAERRRVEDWRPFVASENSWGRMIRSSRFKYSVYESGAVREMLIDMRDDPAEMNNLATRPENAETLRRHRRFLRQWIEQSKDAEAGAFAKDDIKAGRTQPADEVLRELREKHNIPE